MKPEARIDALFRHAVERADVPGLVAIAASGTGMLYEGAFGLRDLAGGSVMTCDTIFRIASMSKAVTSVAAMQLVEEGRIDLDEPAGRFLSELAAPQVLEGFDAAGRPRLRPARRPITLRHLLTHTAGFGYDWANAALRRYAEMTGTPPIASGKRAALGLPLVCEPGERWEYGINTDWVGRLVETVSGAPLDAYLRDRIFTPLAMTDTGFELTAEQARRLAGVHRRNPDGTLSPVAVEAPSGREFWSGGGGLYASARLSDFSAHANEWRPPRRGDNPAAGERCADGREPDRPARCRPHPLGAAGTGQRFRSVARHPVQIRPRLPDQHGAWPQWPQRRQPRLGRHL